MTTPTEPTLDAAKIVADALHEIERFLPVKANRGVEGWDIPPFTVDAGMRANQAIAIAAILNASPRLLATLATERRERAEATQLLLDWVDYPSQSLDTWWERVTEYLARTEAP
ncbi:MAG: hypothetical protein ACLP62_01355 [Acidimicrobiales bacterium]